MAEKEYRGDLSYILSLLFHYTYIYIYIYVYIYIYILPFYTFFFPSGLMLGIGTLEVVGYMESSFLTG